MLRSMELSPEQVSDVERLAGYGLSQDDIADWLGFTDRTLRNVFSQHPNARSAYQMGLARAKEKMAHHVYQKALAGDTTLAIFWLKTRCKWSERVEVTGADGGPIEHQDTGARDWLAGELTRLAARERTAADSPATNGRRYRAP